MNRTGRARSRWAGLVQVLWALLLVYLILFGLFFLFAEQVGYRISLIACLAVAGLTTAAFGLISLGDLLRIVIVKRYTTRGTRRP